MVLRVQREILGEHLLAQRVRVGVEDARHLGRTAPRNRKHARILDRGHVVVSDELAHRRVDIGEEALVARARCWLRRALASQLDQRERIARRRGDRFPAERVELCAARP